MSVYRGNPWHSGAGNVGMGDAGLQCEGRDALECFLGGDGAVVHRTWEGDGAACGRCGVCVWRMGGMGIILAHVV